MKDGSAEALPFFNQILTLAPLIYEGGYPGGAGGSTNHKIQHTPPGLAALVHPPHK